MTIAVTEIANTQTFSAWLATTNRLANLMSQNTVTADSSNGGSVTTGNSFVNGHFGAEFVYVANTLIGGNVTSNGVLKIQANLAVTNGTSNILIVTANSTQSNVRITTNTITLFSSSNVIVSGNTLVVNTANIVFSGANLQFTNSPLSGNITFSSNAVFSSGVIIANGSFGGNGAVLYSNGTGMYWEIIPSVVGNNGIIANADGIFVNANNGLVANSTGVFVNANNGLVANSTGVFVNANNGLVANSTGVFVRANTGIIANATGTYVNSAYIATIDANTSAFSNASSTNTFTVGTASYFVANGNFGIGNSAPVYKLRVEGDISISGGIHANGSLGSADQALFSNGTSVYWANVVGGAVLTANNTDTQTFYIPMANATSGSWSNGVVANTKLYFVPSTGTLNATIFNSLSDESKKTDVVSIQSALDKVLDMRGVEFKWSDNGELSSGVIAQEIEPILPHLVKTDQSGTKSVHYDGLIPYLLEAIKELNEKVKRLENG